jgi:hypothetical protein
LRCFDSPKKLEWHNLEWRRDYVWFKLSYEIVCYLLSLIYTCEYVLYIMLVLLEIPYFFYYHMVVGFGFSENQSDFGSIGFRFGFRLSPESGFRAISSFEFGFRTRVHGGSIQPKSAPLPSHHCYHVDRKTPRFTLVNSHRAMLWVLYYLWLRKDPEMDYEYWGLV